MFHKLIVPTSSPQIAKIERSDFWVSWTQPNLQDWRSHFSSEVVISHQYLLLTR
ncbi:hypothetical protein IQ238_06865 [Pleurocapsales cyanobacterium LEGE 06147]|nr:hypothetical protein [Pleurocapsales cyanobacterium LEGE 06147]